MLVAAAMSLAQVRETSNVPDNVLASGTFLSAALSKSLDANKGKVNDRVEAKTIADLLVHGQIVVPRNTKIIGHIAEVKAHSKTSPGSKLEVVFDRMLLKNGEVRLPMALLSIAPPFNPPSDAGNRPDNLASRTTTPGKLPPVGATPPPTGSSSLPALYPSNLPEPPSITSGASSPVRRATASPKRFSLDTSGSVSVLSSNTENVHLDGGTRLLLRVQ